MPLTTTPDPEAPPPPPADESAEAPPVALSEAHVGAVPLTPAPVRNALEAGERILLIDPKERRYLITLVAGATFHTHAGVIQHDSIIGGEEGRTITGSTGRHFLVLRPTLSDIVLKMPRGAQVIYPKDLGAILIAADLGPGQRVLEAGVGSGALSMTVLRAGASVVGYELREDFAGRAMSNVVATLGPDAPYRVEIRDVTEGIDERDLDRILLDMPEPHKVIPAAAAALTTSVPFVCVVSEAADSVTLSGEAIPAAAAHLVARVFSNGQPHRALPLTISLCAAVTAQYGITATPASAGEKVEIR